MKDFLKKHKKSVLLIVTGALAIAGAYIGIDEEAQTQILKAIE
ncbi:hypothetical protein [Brevibacillus porteri]|nr:hypothetical protein [Brevibacillus porteri]MED4897699.1 hypothetical protein [Brevibacillus porteri]MED4898125.1 hypothetical protein [Brevibacillus porteri]